MIRAAHGSALAPLSAGCLGAAVVLWAGGVRMLDPREVGWVMQGDWQVHFLGWHFFRHEPWNWPPGLIRGLIEPIGTSLGFTDSIPLAAFLFKPFARWLPNPFQYLGLWLLACFTLQGVFATLVLSTWTSRRSLQVLGAMLLVLLPTFAARIAHPALCAHWLLLWALWLNWRAAVPPAREVLEHGALGLASGLVHPYLAVMTLALLLALAGRRLLEREMPVLRAVGIFACAGSGVVVGWWASGLFTLASTADLTASSGTFSMNLLALVNPGAIPSTFLPGFPAVSAAQLGEGYQYLGFGVLTVSGVTGLLLLKVRPGLRRWAPLLVVLAALAVYSILPVIAIGRRVLVDVSGLEWFSLFRSTGRFFWPAAYALAASSAGAVAAYTRSGVAAAVLASALVLQAIDLQQWWRSMHDGSRADAFFVWQTPFRSPLWDELLPSYDRIRLYFPSHCRDGLATSTGGLAYLAGLHGLTLNDGFTARRDGAKQAQSCATLEQDFAGGVLDTGTVYVMAPTMASEFEARLGDAVDCRHIDDVVVCTARRSISSRSLARLSEAHQS